MGEVCGDDTSLATKGVGGRQDSKEVSTSRACNSWAAWTQASVRSSRQGFVTVLVGCPGRREVVPRGFDRSATTLAGGHRT